MDRRRRTRPARTSRSTHNVEPLEGRRLMSASIAAAVADRFEPNDSYDAATNLGTLGDRTESGLSIHAASNNDYFRFTAAASGTVSITISFDQARGDVDAILVNNDRVIIANAATTNGTERLTAPVAAGRTYFMKVLGYNGATQPAYSISVDGPNATTPTPTGDTDDQTREARAIAIGATVSDSVGTSTDVDLYKFTAAAGQRLAFDVDRASGSSLNSFIRVFNSAGSRITSNDNRAAPGEILGTDSYLEYTFTTAGTYYVGVSGSPNASYNANTGANDVAGSTGGYRLFLVNRTTTAAAAFAPQTLSMSLLPATGRDSDALLGSLEGAVV